jgi:hypothetical protein
MIWIGLGIWFAGYSIGVGLERLGKEIAKAIWNRR